MKESPRGETAEQERGERDGGEMRATRRTHGAEYTRELVARERSI